MVDALPLDSLIDPRQRLTAHELVRETLRRAILSGLLPGGTRLVQADIAAQLSVSTTPVREALRDLAGEGLIRIDAHRGAVVHELDMSELEELYEIRKALEPLGLRKTLERLTDAELSAAAALQERMDQETDAGAWTELNWRFHTLIQQPAHSPRLSALIKSLQDASAQYVGHSLLKVSGRMNEGNAEHHGILDALGARDADRAAKILHDHLDRTLKAIVKTYGPDAPDTGQRRPARQTSKNLARHRSP
ncbi:MAG TPA: GntR family transcriptional regulator [Actinomycetes bacterium]|jgi:DNA-binding GntR family transcriptional regulator|nr:GntR family transcriptional regulator [Actinomycetes bacterium]